MASEPEQRERGGHASAVGQVAAGGVAPEPEQRERGDHARANASGSALGQVAAVGLIS